jgi:hypothetical protein
VIRAIKKHREARAAGLPDPTREKLDALNEKLQTFAGMVPGVGPAAVAGLKGWETGRHAVGDFVSARIDKIEDRLHQTALNTPAPTQASTAAAPVAPALPSQPAAQS